MSYRSLWLLALWPLLSGAVGRAQNPVFADDFEAPGTTVDASFWPGNYSAIVTSGEPFFGLTNRYLKIAGTSVKVLSGDWSPSLTNATTTFAFDFYEATNSSTSLILGFAAGTADINTDGAFARISLTQGIIAYGGAEGTSVSATGALTYPPGTPLTFSLVLNHRGTAQPFNGGSIPAKSMEVWCWDWRGQRAVFVMRVDCGNSTRKPVSFGFRTWSTSTGVEVYVDNARLYDGALLATNSVAGIEPQPEPEPERIVPPFPFVHPSVLNSQQDFDRIRYRLSRQTGLAAHAGWTQLRASSLASLGYQHVTYSNVVVMGSGTTPSETQYRNDSQATRAAALQWALTGDARYKIKALTIMNDWANAFVTMSPASGTSTAQIELEAAWSAPVWISAADIIRYYNNGAAEWGATQIAQFDRMLDYLYLQAAKAASRNNNWGASAALTMIATGAYQGDRARYDAGVKVWRDGLTIINAAVGYNGYINEVCRDTVHPQYTLQVWMQAAEIAWKNDLDLFGVTFTGSNAPQFAVNLENFARLFTGLVQPPCSATFQSNYNYLGQQSHSGGYDIAYNHYLHRGGLDATLPVYSRMVTNNWRPGGWDGHFCCWSTLTHGDLSLNLPVLSSLLTTNALSPDHNLALLNGDTCNLENFRDRAARIFAPGNSNTTWVQFYTNGVAFGAPDISPPFVSDELPPGNYFLTAIPYLNTPSGVLPGDPVNRFLRVVQVPSPWMLNDLGLPPEPAVARFGAGDLLLTSAGTNRTGMADQLAFLGAATEGEAQLTARIGKVTGQAGLMLRVSRSPGSSCVALWHDPVRGTVTLDVRAAAYQAATNVAVASCGSQPWLRLTRLGQVVSARFSTDGRHWQLLGATSLSASNFLAGFAACGQTPGAIASVRLEACVLESLNPDYAQWQTWTLAQFGVTNTLALSQAGDPDQDGRSNEWEFRVGSDPLVADTQPLLAPGEVADDLIRLRLWERANAVVFGRACMVSTNLTTWALTTPLQELIVEDHGGTVLRELAFPTIPPASFYRLVYP